MLDSAAYDCTSISTVKAVKTASTLNWKEKWVGCVETCIIDSILLLLVILCTFSLMTHEMRRHNCYPKVSGITMYICFIFTKKLLSGDVFVNI